MEKYRSFLLMVCLTCTIGFPLIASGNPDRFVMVKPILISELQNMIKPINLISLQDTSRITNLADSQNIVQSQNVSGELRIGEEPQEKAKIKFVDNQLLIENLPEDGLLEIYNIMGVKVYNRRVKAGTIQHFLSLPKGYYIIRIGKLTRKIAIK